MLWGFLIVVLSITAVLLDTTITGVIWLPKVTMMVLVWSCLVPKSEIQPWFFACVIGLMLDGADPGSRFFHGGFCVVVCALLRLLRHWLYPPAVLSHVIATAGVVLLQGFTLALLVNHSGLNLLYLFASAILSSLCALIMATLLRPLARKLADN